MADGGIELNVKAFVSRLKRMYAIWEAADREELKEIANAEALLLLSGDPTAEEEPLKKSTCLQQWLLGYEFPSTLIMFEKSRIYILCSVNKAKILNQLKSSSIQQELIILTQAKSKDPPNDSVPKFIEAYANHKRVGVLLKEQTAGKLVTEFNKGVEKLDKKPEQVDMLLAVSAILTTKDEDELQCIRVAANLTMTLLKHHVVGKLETILDRESKISHEQLATTIESRLGYGEGANAKGPDMKVWGQSKSLADIKDWSVVETAYTPIIISRSSSTGYKLTYTVESTSDDIAHKGVLLVSLGMRYKSYCANVGRTFIVDPTSEQEAQYELLVALQQSMLAFMKDGVSSKDAYQHAVDFVQEKKPDLVKNLVKNVGFSMGIEFRDSTFILSPKSTRPLKESMVVNLNLGFSDLTDANDNKYALFLADTVQIGTDKSTLLTDGVKGQKDTMFYLAGESEDEKKPTKKDKKPAVTKATGSAAMSKKVAGNKVLRNQTRQAKDEEYQTTLAKMATHQKTLHEVLQKEGLAKYSEEGGTGGGKEGKGWKRFQSYKGEASLPPDVEKLRIHVDRKAQTIIIPINGFAVAFHVNTIKNATKTDEGDFTHLRINFQTPGQIAGKKEDTPFEDPDATFIRSVTYRSRDGHRFDTVYKQINELKKEANKREQQKREMADVIEQDSLIELKGRRPHKLPEVFVKPALDGKRLPGEVEIHQNGIRYQSPLGSQKIDILFSNIKHLFFQPCDRELIVLIHIHLKSPIMIGKKKSSDVQFFREASDVQFDETGNRKRKHRYGDEDEIEMEQQERRRRQQLNKELRSFAEKVSEAGSASTGENMDLDIPFRELSFEGVPYRTAVRLQPTTECLVHLTDPPFLVVTLSDIEIASLERVQYSLKQFDMVFVFKDFNRPPLHINSIQSSQLDDVKNWLDSVDIPMSEGPVNLNWGPIMKTINDSPYEFFQQGGWSFLGTGEESDQSGASESESDFAASDAISSESSDNESDFSDASDSGSSGFDDDDLSDEGDDWDELERKAAKSDKKRAEDGRGAASDGSDDERPKKKAPAKAKTKAKK